MKMMGDWSAFLTRLHDSHWGKGSSYFPVPQFSTSGVLPSAAQIIPHSPSQVNP